MGVNFSLRGFFRSGSANTPPEGGAASSESTTVAPKTSPYVGWELPQLRKELRTLAKKRTQDTGPLEQVADELIRRHVQGGSPEGTGPLDHRSSKGRTALDDAARKISVSALRTLLRRDADPLLQNPDTGKDARSHLPSSPYMGSDSERAGELIQGWVNNHNRNPPHMAHLNANARDVAAARGPRFRPAVLPTRLHPGATPAPSRMQLGDASDEPLDEHFEAAPAYTPSQDQPARPTVPPASLHPGAAPAQDRVQLGDAAGQPEDDDLVPPPDYAPPQVQPGTTGNP